MFVVNRGFHNQMKNAVAIFFVVLPCTVLQAAPLSFNRDVRPILSDHCFACHGPDPVHRKADLRLDNAGEFDHQEFLRRVFAVDAEEVMPPPRSHKTLSAAQKDL